MPRFNRKVTPKVKGGKVQKKNSYQVTPTYWNTYQEVPVIDRERPGPGYKHFLRKNDILDFICILPDWEQLSSGLDAVLLAKGETDCDGWYDFGVVGICAWNKNEWIKATKWYYNDHQEIFARLNVKCEQKGDFYVCKFDAPAIRAYQLLHIFLHELGHHHDRMSTKSKWRSARGENYAEQYAFKYEKTIWDRYMETFGLEE